MKLAHSPLNVLSCLVPAGWLRWASCCRSPSSTPTAWCCPRTATARWPPCAPGSTPSPTCRGSQVGPNCGLRGLRGAFLHVGVVRVPRRRCTAAACSVTQGRHPHYAGCDFYCTYIHLCHCSTQVVPHPLDPRQTVTSCQAIRERKDPCPNERLMIRQDLNGSLLLFQTNTSCCSCTAAPSRWTAPKRRSTATSRRAQTRRTCSATRTPPAGTSNTSSAWRESSLTRIS